ncbi:MAG: bifunctional phosphopantothenoylcysteine decarboxylase/phosphopantothenate--cysteine ligase CoaBC [Microscillaceae bacterium]|nr:bifunctional phosphopantothenoylcysteine decarboxylase/phosphopantothenate--cysteine ligase CoaBC [Microscillaceae bacterium]
MLKNKKILIGVTGSIAAYKVAMLIRLLVKEDAEVKVIMTEAATEFITPLTLATLSKNPVLVDFVQDNTGIWNNHVELGLWADAFLIAPATAHSIAQCVYGLSDNLLIATYLSARCPVFFAPAMDLDMYQHPSTQRNFHLLQEYNNMIIPAEHGELASGLVGQGRMAEPEHIVHFLDHFFKTENKNLSGKTVLITAGPTREAIDPVRFISNHSSGKMGFALAEKAAELGAEVILISGPVNLTVSHPHIQLVSVQSAQDMYEAANQYFEIANLIILAAAVADFTPETTADQKIKKQPGQEILEIRLRKTVDIAQTFGQQKKTGQVLVGFALETQDEINNAKVKLHKKNLDLIVLNSLRDSGAGFGGDTNKITLIDREENVQVFSLKSKNEVASDILKKALKFLS